MTQAQQVAQGPYPGPGSRHIWGLGPGPGALCAIVAYLWHWISNCVHLSCMNLHIVFIGPCALFDIYVILLIVLMSTSNSMP